MASWLHPASLILAIALLIPAVVSDLRFLRIPNMLCLSGFLAGVLLHGILAGLTGAGLSLAAGLMLLVLMFPFFAIGWMGAGDVKLIAAVGAIAGAPGLALSVFVAIVISGAVIALLVLLWRKGLKNFAAWCSTSLALSFISKRPVAAAANDGAMSLRFPYALAIAAGTFAVLVPEAF